MRRFHLQLYTLVAGALLLSADGHAGQQHAELISVYRQAVQQDARLRAARHEYQAFEEQVPQAWAGLLPSLSAGATVESTRLQQHEPEQTRARSHTVYHATLNQPLLRADRWYALKAAEAGTAQAGLELASREQSLILQSAEAYFDTLRALDALAAANAEAKALRRQQEQAEGRLENGASTVTDVLDAQAAHDNASAYCKLAQRKVDDAFEALHRLTRQHYSGIAGITHQLPVLLPTPNDAALWVDQALQGNLALLASSHAVSAAEQAMRQRKAGHAPTVDAVASYRTGDNDGFGYSNASDIGRTGYRDNIALATLGLHLTVPLFSGGLAQSQVREARQRLAQREDEHEDRRREAVLQTRNLYRAVNADVEHVQARQQSIRSSQASLRANQMGQVLGSRNTADVLDAERRLYRTVREYNDARYDYILDSLKLKQVAGRLAVQDLLDLSRYLNHGYDPDRDFLPPAARAFRSDL